LPAIKNLSAWKALARVAFAICIDAYPSRVEAWLRSRHYSHGSTILFENSQRAVDVLREPSRTCGRKKEHPLVPAILLRFHLRQGVLQHRPHGSIVLRKFTRSEEWNIAAVFPSYCRNLFAVGRDDAT
jgi:hypothetical protein